jgi:predicted esterase
MLAILAAAGFGQSARAANIVWSHPDSVDVFDSKLGDFLDVNLDSLSNRASDFYQAGKYEEAARYYLALLNHNVTDAYSIYDLACCYGLLGKDTLAAGYLRRAVTAGFDNLKHAQNDRDFDKVRKEPVFKAMMDSLNALAEKKAAKLGNLMHVSAPAMFRYRVHLPANYDSTKGYLLVIGLHGLGGDVDNFIRLWGGFGDSNLIYAAAQAPYPYPAGSRLGYSWLATDDSATRAKTTLMSEDYVAAVTRDLTRRYKTDGVYLLGLSQGCAMTYKAGIRYHDLYQGLICFSGWLDTSELTPDLLKAGKGLRVFIAHGKQDQSINYQQGVAARDILKSYGYDVTFRDFEGGHVINAAILKQTVPWVRK